MEIAPTAAPATPATRAWTGRVVSVWLKCLALLCACCAFYLFTRKTLIITDVFLGTQDFPAAGLSVALIGLVALPFFTFGTSLTAGVERLVERRGFLLCLAATVLVAGVSFAGWWLVYQQYPLSMDEFWASFDARIFGHGELMAPIPRQWRHFAAALEPMWRLETPDNRFWASTYLPMNAALRALFGLLGSEALAGPFWAGLSIVLTFDLARRFWPERRDAAFVSAILLATSSQLIVTAMSPYAMSPHLALNLAWLWLLLRRSAWAQVAAAAVAFVATGLHQIVFHPLFAGPFVLQLWFERRWRPAAFHTLAYALIGIFWLSYWNLMLASQGFSPQAARAALAHGASANALAGAFQPAGLNLMMANLLRFTVWQNPLTIPLALIGVRLTWGQWRNPMAPLAAGLIGTLLILLVITPFQGHGWGYRYVHGFLGSVCLLAAFAWIRLTDGARALDKPRAWAAFAAASVFAVAVWLPLRLYQVSDFIRPYARSFAAIRRAPADVVIVDAAGLWYADDLVRNDPLLEQGPKVMHLARLTDADIQDLCARYRVALFDHADGQAFGIGGGDTRKLLFGDPSARKAALACATRIPAR